MKVSNRNKSENKTKHVCDFCGKEFEHLWEGMNIDGQYCFAHFREMHDDVESFDKWCIQFKEYIGDCK
jgi:protein tyrosine/serine phosphatase